MNRSQRAVAWSALPEDDELSDRTCWTLIASAAAGDPAARDEFARRYLPIVRAFVHARGAGRLAPEECEDAVQEVFVECLKEEGLLERVRRGERAGFRGFLHAACRNLAARAEERRARRRDVAGAEAVDLDEAHADDETLGRVFDRAWGEALVREAAERQRERAERRGPDAVRRVELLHLRFHEGLAIREIAERWKLSADVVHHEYAQARVEFERALREVLAFHHPDDPHAVARELRELGALIGG